jgi:hypothetical protein
MKRAVLTFGLLSLFPPTVSLAVTRLVVHKNQGETGPLPVQILNRAAAVGYSVVADYDTMTVIKGPDSVAPSLVAAIRALGREAERPTDLETFSYHDQLIDADKGPTVAGEPGELYFLTLQSYPKVVWLSDLEQQGVRVLQALGPVSYVVRATPGDPTRLFSSRPWLRGAFPLPAAFKTFGFFEDPSTSSPFREVTLRVAEENQAESLMELLSSLSATPVEVQGRAPGEVTYLASLADVDINTIRHIDRVFEISQVGHPVPSSERQAQLIAQAGSVTNGESTLPSPNPSGNTYLQWLASKGLGITANTFDNTKVGVIDTGFDNATGTPSYSAMPADFHYTYGGQQYAIVSNETTAWLNPNLYDDVDYHGTEIAAIIAGYPASNRVDTDGYLFGLGVAPTVRLAVDKFFKCGAASNSTQNAIDRVTPTGANVINMSFNLGGSAGCAYTTNESRPADLAARASNVLFTIAAGNSPEGCTGNYVRAPATAKDGLAVGSTDNFTLSAWANNSTENTCAWDTFPLAQDARRIPNYSAVRDPSSLVKPDLVAPSTRVTGPASRDGNPSCGVLCNSSVASFPADGVTYVMSAGTSFAAPAAAGAAAVVRKWYRNNKGADPSPAMTKAMLINGARDIAGAVVRDQSFNTVATIQHIFFDAYQGWGMLSFERLLGTWANYYFYDQATSFSTSGTVWTSPTLTVRDLTKPVEVTLTWTDPAGSAGTHYTTLNNLNLNVYAGTNTILNWQGNYINSSTGFTLARPPGVLFRDSVNNVERVVLPTSAFDATHRTISVTVTAFSLPQPAQDFALAVENAGQ